MQSGISEQLRLATPWDLRVARRTGGRRWVWWRMAQRKGRSATTVRSGSGGNDVGKAVAVEAAASVPFSSTITLAPWSAVEMEESRSDAIETRARAETERAEPFEQVGRGQGLLPLGHG